MDIFDAQRSRGVEGFGLFDGQYMHIVKAKTEDKILKWLVKYDSNLILFHHRYPTSTINVEKAAHPFSTKKFFKDEYIMVHNGQIWNETTLYKDHQALGIKYQSKLQDDTFNDSEALLWDLALTLEGKQTELKSRGNIAFVCIKKHKGVLDKLYFARNTNPLKMIKTDNSLTLSSEGEGKNIDAQTLYTWDYKTKTLTKKYFDILQYSSWDNSCAPWDPDDNLHYQAKNYPARNLDRLRDKYGKWLNSYEIKDETGHTVEEVDLDYEPTGPEIESQALSLIIKHEGIFETAYMEIEDKYNQIWEDCETDEEVREAVLLERVMEFLYADPEWVGPYSRSSIWMALWEKSEEQVKLLT